jgi:hypothetical protein
LILAISLVMAICSSAIKMSTYRDFENFLGAYVEALLGSLQRQIL